jgi:lysophosphatidylcholine acyltransferase/lyso-PAF acetyltransferase
MENRQLENEKTGRSPLLVYPEGATTNNKSIIEFKRGAFSSLCSIMPICLKYKSANGISP